MTETALKAVVLAAGQGKRLRIDGSDIPKVMRQVCGRPLIAYVLDAIDFIKPEDTVVVVGHLKERVIEAFPSYCFAVQTKQYGTGHAVKSAYDALLTNFTGDLLICCGDMPLLRGETYAALVDYHRSQGNVCTILSGSSDKPLPYGRIIRDAGGAFVKMVEDKDCTPEERKIHELNSGVYIFDSRALGAVLSAIGSDNAQHEYYLTDAPALIMERGLKVGVCYRELGPELLGVNDMRQLHEVERELRKRDAKAAADSATRSKGS